MFSIGLKNCQWASSQDRPGVVPTPWLLTDSGKSQESKKKNIPPPQKFWRRRHGTVLFIKNDRGRQERLFIVFGGVIAQKKEINYLIRWAEEVGEVIVTISESDRSSVGNLIIYKNILSICTTKIISTKSPSCSYIPRKIN